MYTNLFFSEFYQTSMFEASVKTSVRSEKSNGFDSFLSKYQSGDFDFVKASSSSATSKLNKLKDISDPNEKIISLLVDHMKEVLRNISEGSSVVSFSFTEISSLRQVLVSSENLSIDEINSFLNANASSGSYLPDVLSSLDNINQEKINSENVYFPFSLVPYFATALESIGVKPFDITETIESSSDVEKGFSLKSFLENLDRIKAESIEKINSMANDESVSSLIGLDQKALLKNDTDLIEYSRLESVVKGIETIQSVFSLSGSEESLIKLDKNSLNKFVAAMEKRLNSKISDLDLYKKSILSSSKEKESDFVKSLLDIKGDISGESDIIQKNFITNEFNKKIVEESFMAWKRNQRLLSEENLNIQKSEYEQKLFEKSGEYSLFTSNPSGQSGIDSVLHFNNPLLNSVLNEMIQSQTLSDSFDFDIKDSDNGDNDLNTLFKSAVKNLKKEFSRDSSEDGSDYMDRSSSKGSGEVLKSTQSSSGTNLSKQVMEQIEKQILRTVKLGEKEVSFRLNPPDLGRLHLKIESVRNGLNIKIIAEKSSTHEIMVQQAQEFKNQLQSQGMQVSEVNVELAQNFDQAMARERKNSFENNSKNKNAPEIRGLNSGNKSETVSGIVSRKSIFSDNALDLMV